MVTGIGVKMRKGVLYATRSCFRSVCNHPFIVAMLCILILLHRASPFVFSLLVSASPVIVCTLLLLGTLLSFGQLNIPEIEIEEKITRQTVLIKTGVAKNVAFSENDSLYAERYSNNNMSEAEEGKLAEARKDDSTNDSAPLMDRKSVDLESDNEENRDSVLSDDTFKQQNEWNKEGLIDLEIVKNHSVTSLNIEEEHLESETEKSEADSFDSERVNVDSLDSPPRSPWKRVRAHDDDDDERDGDGDDGDDDERDGDDDALDSGSDGAESSSPDASMADIMPMLDELHPLLDEENPQPIQISRGGSDAGSEMSSKSSSSSSESDDDDVENNMDVEVAEDDNDDGEDEEVQDNKESASKSVITWTEEDQKNLMDLGSSELERNQRLESLILRRRARKNLSMVPERNLIDFESNDFPFHITPITTMRQNPFDLPNDSHSYSGLPPIPGSAPSILIPRRNPFDIPYDASEEKPNLSNDGFQEEYVTVQSREPFFKRHESFNVGPSTFSHGRQDVSRFRPYFVPDRSISEESNYSPYQRNSSELSDSKVSSVPETESIGSVENLEDLKFTEENKQEFEVIPTEKEEFCEETELITEREVTEKDGTHDVETVSKIKHVSEDVGHGSHSSSEEDNDEKEEEEEEDEEEKEYSELDELEKRDFENDTLQFQSPDSQDQYEEEESVVQHKQKKASDCESGSEDVELRYNGNSSSSSFSDVSESFFPESRGQGSSVSEERRDDIARERHLSTQTSTGSTDLNISSPVVDDFTHKEPVYDSSPSAVRKNLSSSSISSDVHVEADQSLPPVLVKRTVSFVGIEPEDFPRNIEMLPEASDNRSIVEHESHRKEISMIKLNDVKSDVSSVHLRVQREDTSEIHQIYENEDASKADPSYESREASAYSLEENSRNQTTDVASSSSQQNNQVSGQSSKERVSVQLEEEKHLVISDKEKRIQVNLPEFNRHLEIKCPIEKEENIASPSSDVEIFHEANEKLISTPSADGGTPLFYDVVMHEPFKHLEEVQVPNTPVGSFEEPRDITSLTIPQLQLLNRDTPTSFYSPRSPDFVSMASSASGEVSSHIDLETIIEEVDEIKEIDEGILSELDSDSDFHITQQGSDSNASAKHVDSVGECAPTAHYSVSQSMELDVRHQETFRDEIVERVDTSDKELNDSSSHDSSDHIKSYVETSTNSSESVLCDVVDQNLQDIPVISVANVLSVVETDSFPRKADSVRAETEFKSESSGASQNSQLDDADDVVSEIEAQTVKDIEVEVTQSSVKDVKKPIVSESLQSSVVVHETTGQQSEDKTQYHANTSVKNSIREMQVIEARPVKDSSSDHKQVEDDSMESCELPHSVYQQENSREVQLSSESHAAEVILKEDGPSKQVLYELPNPTNNVESKVDTPSPSVHMELSVKEISLIVSEKSVHEVRISHSTKSDKGKLSKSSSSSSSSSSESSSSDSE